MTHDIESVLKRYRPAGPDPDLRARVLLTAGPSGRIWPWAAAAAVLLSVTLGCHAATARIHEPAPPANDRAREAAVEELTILLGGPDARPIAERLIAEQSLRRELEAAHMPAAASPEVR